MEEKYISDESFIARWIAGELTEDEVTAFKKTDAFKDFEFINKVSQEFSPPPIDKKQSLIALKEHISFKKKQKKKQRITYLSIAASIIILVGLLGVFNSSKSYTTGFGQQLAITLPDNSEVQLNANSFLTHKRFFWELNRNVDLNGEAFFKVQKGEKFIVKTSYGSVSVLGTQFNIKSRKKSFELKCFEGSVRFNEITGTTSKILKPSDAIRIEKGKITQYKASQLKPNWIEQRSIFNSIPLKEVLEEMGNQFGVVFKSKTVDTSKRFSGMFLYNDLEEALQATLIPMGIDYTISINKKTVTLK